MGNKANKKEKVEKLENIVQKKEIMYSKITLIIR